jgi:predicted dehydrogenase
VGATPKPEGARDGQAPAHSNGIAGPVSGATSAAAPQLSRSDPDLGRLDWDQATDHHSEGVQPVRVGVIGYGYWGPNLVRNFAEYPGAEVAQVADLREERLAPIGRRYPGVATTTDHRDLLRDPSIDAIVISTPISTHFELALQSLQAGKHVLVEKTLTASSEQALRLIEEAERRRLVLMVDHTFVYTGAVQKIKELVGAGRLGRIYYWDSVRVNLGLFQQDTNVLWDLAVHDLSIMDTVLGVRPTAVAATGISIVPGRPINTGYLTCFFERNLIAHFHVNWLAPVKVRRTLIGGDAQMIVYDDLEPSEKVKIYDRGITMDTPSEEAYELMVGYRVGDMWAPRVSLTEALRLETQHFVDCVRTGRQSLTDGRAGLRVVSILEAATKSLRQGGQPVEVDWDGESANAALPLAQRQRGFSAGQESTARATIGSDPRSLVG